MPPGAVCSDRSAVWVRIIKHTGGLFTRFVGLARENGMRKATLVTAGRAGCKVWYTEQNSQVGVTGSVRRFGRRPCYGQAAFSYPVSAGESSCNGSQNLCREPAPVHDGRGLEISLRPGRRGDSRRSDDGQRHRGL